MPIGAVTMILTNVGLQIYNYPKSYFDLLTPTDIEFANEWREEMRKRYAQKENERKNKTRRN